jgi:hypothetical protein
VVSVVTGSGCVPWYNMTSHLQTIDNITYQTFESFQIFLRYSEYKKHSVSQSNPKINFLHLMNAVIFTPQISAARHKGTLKNYTVWDRKNQRPNFLQIYQKKGRKGVELFCCVVLH